MKKNIQSFLLFIVLTIMGAVAGSAVSDTEVKAITACDGTTCQYDFFGGFRCFGGVNDNYTCSDAGYPNCAEFFCGQPDQ